MIKAALKLMVSHSREPRGRIAEVKQKGKYVWQVARLIYQYVPTIDNAAVYAKYQHYGKAVLLIAPPRHDLVLFHALNDILGRRRMPNIFDIYNFVSWRTLWAMGDSGKSHEAINVELLSLYSACCNEDGVPELCVNLPLVTVAAAN